MLGIKKKFIIITIILISLFTIYKLPILFIKKEYKPLPEVNLKEKVNKDKSFAIMVQENSENDKYLEYSSNTWPGDDYQFKEAKCIDNNGNLVENFITYEDGKITLTTNKTVYCTVYFDKSILGKLREKDQNNVLSTEEVGGMYRYQGVGTEEGVDATHKLVDNNYICFGTDKKEECINKDTGYDKYMYRIIGITEEGELYLIKMKGIEEGSNNSFAWNSKNQSQDCNGELCEWPNVDLYKRINGIASNGNPIFINNEIYEYMQEQNEWYNLIEEHSWMYGDVDGYNTTIDGETVYGANNNGLILYEIETGVKPTQTYDYLQNKSIKHQWSVEKSVNAKISLMYLHDYYLAYDNERNWRNDYDNTNWIFIDNNNKTTGLSYEWLISRTIDSSNGYFNAWSVINSGRLSNSRLDTLNAIRPTFYLSSKTKISSGSGKISDPFIIKI